MEKDNINNILGIGNPQPQNTDKSIANKNRYPALLTISGIFRAVAWIVGIATLILTVYISKESGIFAFISLIIGGLIVLSLASLSEIIKVFIDIEYNTRQKQNKE